MSGGGIVGLDLAEIERALPGEPKFRARQIYDAVYRQRVTELARLSNLPRTLKERLSAELPLGLPVIERFYDSADGTRRYLMRMADGKTIETVWMPEEDRSTMCISSQAGCAVGCKFCLTALLGPERNLTAGEIVGQVLAVTTRQKVARGTRLNLVFMGMGEPMLNLGNVTKAVEILADPKGVGVTLRRITVSTVGIVPRIEEFAHTAVRPKLAISLNASDDDQRSALMPINKKYPLADLLRVCRAYPLRPWEHLTFEYVLLEGFNDSDGDARRVAELLRDMRAKVNLIPYNSGGELPFRAPPFERIVAFQKILSDRRIPTFIRISRGQDIRAACGQLSLTMA